MFHFSKFVFQSSQQASFAGPINIFQIAAWKIFGRHVLHEVDCRGVITALEICESPLSARYGSTQLGFVGLNRAQRQFGPCSVCEFNR